jgi:hypothetical protein
MLSRPVLAALIGLAAVATGCGIGSSTQHRAPANGGFTGRSAVIYHYAYVHRYPPAKRAATARPFGSGPPIYPLSRGHPEAAIGPVKPHGTSQMTAMNDGCALAEVNAFADVHSPDTAEDLPQAVTMAAGWAARLQDLTPSRWQQRFRRPGRPNSRATRP